MKLNLNPNLNLITKVRLNFLFLLVVLPLASCMTRVSSRLVTEEGESRARGVRYRLPQPFLLVTPTKDGLKVDKLMLPDYAAEYALDVQSYMASHKCTIQLNGGMLQKVSFDVDNTKVATDAIGAVGELAKTQIESMPKGLKNEGPAGGERSSAAYLEQPGAMLFKVVQSRDGVALRRVFARQEWLQTVRKDGAGGGGGGGGGGGTAPVKQKADMEVKQGAVWNAVFASVPAGFAVKRVTIRFGAGTPMDLKAGTFKLTGTSLAVTIPESTNPLGGYHLDVYWSADGNANPSSPLGYDVTVVAK
ncbi:hypothetical protein [Prosthecobacter sp.]|uniref:hypothetical protein n=1 Tax=Prosthecobacter sp. TaxID=1965333 RepID=UPI003783705A